MQPLGSPWEMLSDYKYRKMAVDLEGNRLAARQNQVLREVRDAWLQAAFLEERERLLTE